MSNVDSYYLSEFFHLLETWRSCNFARWNNRKMNHMCHDSNSHILFNESHIQQNTLVVWKMSLRSYCQVSCHVCFGRSVYFQTLKTLQPTRDMAWISGIPQWKWFEKWKISWKSSRCYPVVIDGGKGWMGLYPKNPISPPPKRLEG